MLASRLQQTMGLLLFSPSPRHDLRRTPSLIHGAVRSSAQSRIRDYETKGFVALPNRSELRGTMNMSVLKLHSNPALASVEFRGAMRHLAGGVSVITVGRDKDISGMTVTSVSSLSIEPPTLIVSVNRGSSSWLLLRRHGAFGVNLLNADQLDVAERFAGKGGVKGADRFAGAGIEGGAIRCAPPGGRAGGDRLRGRGCIRTAFACHRDRTGAGCSHVGAQPAPWCTGRANTSCWTGMRTPASWPKSVCRSPAHFGNIDQ